MTAQRTGVAPSTGRWPKAAVLAIGIGLVAAPAIFQMFTRAPGGGEMLDDFRPFMDPAVLGGFQGYLDQADASVSELGGALPTLFADRLGAPPETVASEFPNAAGFLDAWPGIYEDMSGMLTSIQANIDNFEAVDALPPFPLFPWFFVGPGAIIAVLAGLWVRARGPAIGLRRAVVAMGIGLIAAPLVFQMFSRAPLGGAMIDDFRPLMTPERITEVQRYFVTMGAGEGAVRNQVMTRLTQADGMSSEELAAALPETHEFIAVWPTMSLQMAPMMGAMSDNVGNFAGVAALPPFPLFPWFFAIPGVMVVALAWAGSRTPAPVPSADDEAGAVAGMHPRTGTPA